jgi:hypothetical protein
VDSLCLQGEFGNGPSARWGIVLTIKKEMVKHKKEANTSKVFASFLCLPVFEQAGWLYVKTEVHDIAILDNICFPFH